jgi:transcriptional regulator with XRE-family HTH domain
MNGSKIKRIREMLGKTQEEVAEKLNLTAQAYSRMERGETSVSMERLAQIAAAFEMKVEDIYRFDEKKVIITGNNNNHGEAKENAFQLHLTINDSDKAIEILEKTIAAQQEEIKHLRKQVEKLTELLLKK